MLDHRLFGAFRIMCRDAPDDLFMLGERVFLLARPDQVVTTFSNLALNAAGALVVVFGGT